MPIDVKDLVIRSLTEELYAFDTTVDRTTAIRDKVIDKLVQSVENITVINLSDAEAAAAQMGVLTTTLRAISDQEATAARKVSAKLKQLESQRADNTSEQVVKLIQQISMQRAGGANAQDLPPLDLEGTSLDLEQALHQVTIPETELRPDPDDLH